MASDLLSVPVQVVGYERAGTPDETAALLVADGADVQRVGLSPGATLAYTLGERRCAGTVTERGHEPCEATTAPYCADHRSRWACARCTGDCDLPLASCREEHAVYLAAFPPDVFKVGVTRSWRLERRLREQGAVRAAHVRTVADGRVARRLEADIAAELTDRVRVPTKIRGLAEPLDTDAWEAVLDDFEVLARYAFDYGLDLSTRPVAETLASGTVVGTKGRVLVLERAGGMYAVDMRDLVGYELRAGSTDRHLQSSLGSW